jgi:hypothetical protein
MQMTGIRPALFHLRAGFVTKVNYRHPQVNYSYLPAGIFGVFYTT